MPTSTRQFDNLPLVEMASQRLEHVVGNLDLAGRGIREGERGALARVKQVAGAPVGEGVAFGLREALGRASAAARAA